jgi:hypothetical protein
VLMFGPAKKAIWDEGEGTWYEADPRPVDPLIQRRLAAEVDAHERPYRQRVVEFLFTIGSDRLNQAC